MQLQVYKFGGAAVRDAAGIQNVARIVALRHPAPTIVVVSAMDKTTNALERLASLATLGQQAQAREALASLRDFHFQATEHLPNASEVQQRLEVYLGELSHIVEGILLLQDFPSRIYDRIMAFGELMSSVLLHETLLAQGLPAQWLDSRQLIGTDSNWQNAAVIWEPTLARLQSVMPPLLQAGRLIVMQGYIGANSEGRTTTLGREGSDFTASIVGAALGAEAVVVWKDVPGVMNADPRRYRQAVLLNELSYEQAVEMTFYGASVLHPKTIKPLRNRQIPLFVRSFLQPEAPGTRIYSPETQPSLPAVVLHRNRQALLEVRPKDLSFMDEKQTRAVFEHCSAAGISVGLAHTTAISLVLCVDEQPERLADVRARLKDRFDTQLQNGLQLLSCLYDHCDWQLPVQQPLLSLNGPGRCHWVITA